MPRILILLCLGLVLSGCAGGLWRSEAPPPPHPDATIRERLLAQHRDWRGTPYRLGGTSRSGIDCSAFVQKTFARHFGRRLPRTTDLQADVGQRVDEAQRRPGDLVFFKTGLFTRHVGIYLGQGRFLHAATNTGVTITDLDDRYWEDSYWQTRRVW